MGWFEEQGLPPDRTVQPRGGAPNAPQGGQPQGGGPEPFDEDEFRDLVQSFPPTNEGVRAAYEAAKARWGDQTPELLEHPKRLDKFKFANGRVVDFIGGAGGPNPVHVWNYEGPGGGGGGAAGNWQAGIDPSYAFVAGEAQKALESGAAAKGTLLTGGFQKDMAKYMAGLASTEFGNIFGRNMSLANLGLSGAQGQANAGSAYGGQIGANTANQAQGNMDLTTGAANARAGATAAGGQIWGNTIGNIGGGIAGQMNYDRARADWLRNNPYGQNNPYNVPYRPGPLPGAGSQAGQYPNFNYGAPAGQGVGYFPGWDTTLASDQTPGAWGGGGGGYRRPIGAGGRRE